MLAEGRSGEAEDEGRRKGEEKEKKEKKEEVLKKKRDREKETQKKELEKKEKEKKEKEEEEVLKKKKAIEKETQKKELEKKKEVKKKEEKKNKEEQKNALFIKLKKRYEKVEAEFNEMDAEDEGESDDGDGAILEQIVASRRLPLNKQQYLCKWHNSMIRTWEDSSALTGKDALTDYRKNGEVTCKQWRAFVVFNKDANEGDDWPTGETIACKNCNHVTTTPVLCVACGDLTCDNADCTVIVVACVCVARARVCSTYTCVSALTYLLIHSRTQ